MTAGTATTLRGYLNGELVDPEKLVLPFTDWSVLSGEIVYEFTRSFGQNLFKKREHMERLVLSQRALGFDPFSSVEELEQATDELVTANLGLIGEDEFAVFHGVLRGTTPGSAPRLLIKFDSLAWALGTNAHWYDGIHAVIPCQRTIPSRYRDPKIKMFGRAHYDRAQAQAEARVPGSVAVLEDEHGFLSECQFANFFIVRDGVVLTPRGHNILRGISRRYCMELARELGMQVREADIDRYDAITADEAWITRTTFCMLPVVRFEDADLGTGKPGPVYEKILAAWSKAVGVDIRAHARVCAGAL